MAHRLCVVIVIVPLYTSSLSLFIAHLNDLVGWIVSVVRVNAGFHSFDLRMFVFPIIFLPFHLSSPVPERSFGNHAV